MEITLTTELESLINEELQTGKYFSPTDVLREGLLLLKSRKKERENVRKEIQKGIDAIRKGNSTSYNSADEMIEDVINEARKDFESRKITRK
jgi:antitoxin ParD1/3/4